MGVARSEALNVPPLQFASNDEHGLDSAEAPVVVVGRCQKLLVESVECHELRAEALGLSVAFRSKQHLADIHEVRHDHGAWPEQSLDVLWQFSPSFVTRIHSFSSKHQHWPPE